MKNPARSFDRVCKSLAIAFLISFSIFPAAAQNIATSFPSVKVNTTDITNSSASLRVYPNPAADEAKLVFYSIEYSVPYQVRILNNEGASLKKIEGTMVQGQNTIRIHMGKYPPGVYYVQLLTSSGRETLRLLKQPLNSFN